MRRLTGIAVIILLMVSTLFSQKSPNIDLLYGFTLERSINFDSNTPDLRRGVSTRLTLGTRLTSNNKKANFFFLTGLYNNLTNSFYFNFKGDYVVGKVFFRRNRNASINILFYPINIEYYSSPVTTSHSKFDYYLSTGVRFVSSTILIETGIQLSLIRNTIENPNVHPRPFTTVYDGIYLKILGRFATNEKRYKRIRR